MVEPVATVAQVRVAPAVLAIFAGCSQGLPASPPAAWTQVTAVPVQLEGSMDVTPVELGDDAGVRRMRHRVRLKNQGRAWLSLDGKPLEGSGGGDMIDAVLPAIGESARRIRVVTEADGSRLAV